MNKYLLYILIGLSAYALANIIIKIVNAVILTVWQLKSEGAVKLLYENGGQTELEACPFCGGNHQELIELQTSPDDSTPLYQVICSSEEGGCDSSTGLYATQLDAITAWNTRNNFINNIWTLNEEKE